MDFESKLKKPTPIKVFLKQKLTKLLTCLLIHL